MLNSQYVIKTPLFFTLNGETKCKSSKALHSSN
jgi:hypothetical protein